MTVNTSCYLIVGQRFDERGHWQGRPSVRLTAKKPSVARHEVVVKVEIDLPNSLFQRPALTARVTVPEGTSTPEISVDMQQAIADLVRDNLGIHLTISAPE